MSRELRSLGQWQPIETAPRDGTRILAAHTRVPEWVDMVSWQYGGEYPWHNGPGSFRHDYFTHWMPLPAPPVDVAQASRSDAAIPTSPPHRKRYRRMNKDDEPVADATLKEGDEALVNLLRSMARGTDHIKAGHAPIFIAAADRIEANICCTANNAALVEAAEGYLEWCRRSLNAGPVGNPRTHNWHNARLRAAVAKAQGREASGSPNTENEALQALGSGGLK